MDSTALPRRSFSWLRSSSSSALQRVLRGRVFSAGFPMMGMWFFSAKMEKRWEKMDSLKTYFVCVKPCTVFFPFMENGVLQKISQKLLATYQRWPAARQSQQMPASAATLTAMHRYPARAWEGRRRPENSVKFGGDTMTWLWIIRVLKQHTCGFDSYQPVTKICCHPETVGWFTGFPWIMIIHNIFGSTTPYYCEMP